MDEQLGFLVFTQATQVQFLGRELRSLFRTAHCCLSEISRTARISTGLLGKDPNCQSQKRPGGPALNGMNECGEPPRGWLVAVAGVAVQLGPRSRWAMTWSRDQPPAAETGPRTQPPGEILNQGSVPRMAWESPLYLREIFPPSLSLPQSRLGVLGKVSSRALFPPFIPCIRIICFPATFPTRKDAP